METFVLTYLQTLNITDELPTDWELKCKKVNIKFDADYHITDSNVWVTKKRNKIERKIVIVFQTNLITDDYFYYADDNIIGHHKTPTFCKWISETGDCYKQEE